MHHRQEELVRVGVRLVLVAAIAALLVLLFQGNAYPAEPETPADVEQAARMLVEVEPQSPAERASEARSLLRSERWQRVGGPARAFADLAWRGTLQASPLALARSGKRLLWQLWGIAQPLRVEPEAMLLLEHDVSDGLADPSTLDLYERLRANEEGRHCDALASEARAAIRSGDLEAAERPLRRLRALRPDDERTRDLESELAEVELLLVSPALTARAAAIAPGESSRAAELLTGQYQRLTELSLSEPDARLGRAAALFLSGQRGDARAALRDLEGSETPAGLTARSWLGDPLLDAESVFVRERRSYRLRRALGWIGGKPLEARGLELSGAGLRSWRQSLTPLNLVVGFPARAIGQRRVDDTGVRAAAELYLAAEPDGELRSQAAGWVEEPPVSRSRADAAWVDGRLVLPAARTSYASLLPSPLLVSRALVSALPDALGSELGEPLGDADALLLVPAASGAAGDVSLSEPLALALVGILAQRLEEGDAASIGATPADALEGLRRLESSIRAGGAARVVAWSGSHPALISAFSDAAVDGRGAAGPLEFRRAASSMLVQRELVSVRLACPRRVLCLDRMRSLEARTYARAGYEGDVRVGTRARFQHAEFAVEMGYSGPSATLVLPLTRWLGLSRWLPFGARVDVSLEGVSVGPDLVDTERGGS